MYLVRAHIGAARKCQWTNTFHQILAQHASAHLKWPDLAFAILILPGVGLSTFLMRLGLFSRLVCIGLTGQEGLKA